jgi:signal transduction histidine kinase
VQVLAQDIAAGFELAVINSGPPIRPEAMDSLFKPFFRSLVQPSKAGLGLGLYIASEIAKAHGGTLEAVSDESATMFRFTIPRS